MYIVATCMQTVTTILDCRSSQTAICYASTTLLAAEGIIFSTCLSVCACVRARVEASDRFAFLFFQLDR